MTAHSEALGALRTWPAPSREQAAVRDRLVTHLVEHPDGLERSCSPGHLTAGALVLSADLAEVLLNLHGRAGRWFHFGGHWERGDDSLLTTASREASEESGIAGLVVDPTPVHLDVHEVEFCRGHGRVDHLDVRWWPLGALPDLEPEMHELIARSRERLASRATAQSREAGSSRAAVE